MRAVWYERKGAARKVLNFGEMDAPQPGAGEVLVRVHASGVNPSDTKRRVGWGGNLAMEYPRVVPHNDGAGVIEKVGEGVAASRVGERVWIYEAQLGRPYGTAADYVVVPSRNAVPLPDSTGFAEGACLGVPAMTAHYCVLSDGAVKGQTVLVSGGVGAVGYYAVQFAKWGAARVIATVSSPEKADAARAAGADYALDYKTEDVTTRVKEITEGEGVDRIVEVAFGNNIRTDASVLKPNGVLATYASDDEHEPRLPFYDLVMKNITMRLVLIYATPKAAHEAAIRDITTCLESSALRHRVARRFALTEVAAAHEALESGETSGKIVVDVS